MHEEKSTAGRRFVEGEKITRKYDEIKKEIRARDDIGAVEMLELIQAANQEMQKEMDDLE